MKGMLPIEGHIANEEGGAHQKALDLAVASLTWHCGIRRNIRAPQCPLGYAAERKGLSSVILPPQLTGQNSPHLYARQYCTAALETPTSTLQSCATLSYWPQPVSTKQPLPPSGLAWRPVKRHRGSDDAPTGQHPAPLRAGPRLQSARHGLQQHGPLIILTTALRALPQLPAPAFWHKLEALGWGRFAPRCRAAPEQLARARRLGAPVEEQHKHCHNSPLRAHGISSSTGSWKHPYSRCRNLPMCVRENSSGGRGARGGHQGPEGVLEGRGARASVLL